MSDFAVNFSPEGSEHVQLSFPLCVKVSSVDYKSSTKLRENNFDERPVSFQFVSFQCTSNKLKTYWQKTINFNVKI